MPGTPGHCPGNCRIAVPARLRRWDVRLLGTLCQWLEAAWEGYAPPCGIGRHQPLGRPRGHGPAAVEGIPPLAAMGAADDIHRPFRVPPQPAEGEREAGGEADDDGAVVVEVHGADGAPTVWQIADGGWTAPLRVVVMFVVGDVNRGVHPWTGSAQVGAGQGGRGGGVVGSSPVRTSIHSTSGLSPPPRAIVPDVLLYQGAQCVECEVFGLRFVRRQSCAELMRSPAKWA